MARGHEAGGAHEEFFGPARMKGVVVTELDHMRIPASKAMAVRIDGSLPQTVGNREGA